MALDIELRIPGVEAIWRYLDGVTDRLVGAGAAVEALTEHFDKLNTAAASTDKIMAAAGKAKGSGKKTAAEKVEETAQAAKTPKTRFLGGPNQLIRQIEEQQKLAADIADAQERAAVEADLDIRKFRALRSKFLGEKRLAQGDSAIQAEGLLDLFQSLNGLMKGLAAGNTAGVLHGVFDLTKMFNKAEGGLNVEQKARRANLDPAGRRDSSAALPADAAQLAKLFGKGAGKGLGDFILPAAPALSDFVLPATEAAAGAEALAGATSAATASASGLAAMLAATGPIGLAIIALVVVVTGSVLALKTLADVTKQAADNLKAFSEAAAVSGGGSKDVASLAAFGMSPQQIGALSTSLRQQLTAGSGSIYAQMAAAQFGVGPQMSREMGGRSNDAELLVQIVNGLRGMRDRPDEQRLAAARLGPEFLSLLPRFNVSDPVWDAQQQDGLRGARISDRGAQQAAMDFSVSLERVGANFQQLITALGKPFLQTAAFWAGKLADALGGMAEWASENELVIRGMVGAVLPLVGVLDALYLASHSAGKVLDWTVELFGALMDNLRASPIGYIVDAFDTLNLAILSVAPVIGHTVKRIANALKWLDPVGGAVLGMAAEALLGDPTKDLKDAQKAHAAALKAHSDAMDSHAQALRQGTYGGGDRVRRAVPRGLIGGYGSASEAEKRGIENRMLRELGAWSL